MKNCIIIPARYSSTRFPGKPLELIRLPDDSHKTLVELTWAAGQRIEGADAVIVATDDKRIAQVARDAGAEVIMTSPECANGTERCAEAVEIAGLQAECIVNLQGDAPLVPPWYVQSLIDEMATDQRVKVATPVQRFDRAGFARAQTDHAEGRSGATSAVFGSNGDALYFSRTLLPWFDDRAALPDPAPAFHHVGVYAYRPEVLRQYRKWPTGRLEGHEQLEQLRFLENGVSVRCVQVDPRGHEFWEVNNPADIRRVEAALARAQ